MILVIGGFAVGTGIFVLVSGFDGVAVDLPTTAPIILTCDHDVPWRTYGATLDGERLRAEKFTAVASAEARSVATPSHGLPRVCAVLDEDLLRWSLSNLLVDTDDYWEGFKKRQYVCGPTTEERDCESLDDETVYCLYGMISSLVCVAVMYAWNTEVLGPYTGEALKASDNLATLLELGDRPLEFLDSSGWPFTVADIASVVSAYKPLLSAGLLQTETQAEELQAEIETAMATNVDVAVTAAEMAAISAKLAAVEAAAVAAFQKMRGNEGENGVFIVGPWTRSGPSWAAAVESAAQTLSLIAQWRWPPGKNLVASSASGGFGDIAVGYSNRAAKPWLVRIWAFGTHCAVMSEPISAMSLLLSEDFRLKVAWRGVQDYCGYMAIGHRRNGTSTVGDGGGDGGELEWPFPVRDEDSAARRVFDANVQKDEPSARSSHRDRILQPALFASGFREVLASDVDFLSADLSFCSEPALACMAMRDADTSKPVLGYFGVHVGFMLHGIQEQLGFYKHFRDWLVQDRRSTFATVAPYISAQLLFNMPVEVPAVRPLSLYTLPSVYSASRPTEILVNKRPIAFFDLMAILTSFADSSGRDFSFVDAQTLYYVGKVSFDDWAAFRAGVYYPYDWLQTMTLYDWINIGLPTFVPDIPIYAFARGTNCEDAWEAASWHVPKSVYPYHFADWSDLPGRIYWWHMTDFHALPGVSTFRSVSHLFMMLSPIDALWRQSGKLRAARLIRTAETSRFWRDALLRALAKPVGTP
eukprot:TRINITY_DN6193_c0_g2_i1.p1 TRINITY_DN6193_c0_g2~~TRINITY_DN6193_c0_g2_i1.p1  ORF type:complete len:756 (+),score=114.41 TRINITY_DN6193_c0_g2_i1:62-2329(+)